MVDCKGDNASDPDPRVHIGLLILETTTLLLTLKCKSCRLIPAIVVIELRAHSSGYGSSYMNYGMFRGEQPCSGAHVNSAEQEIDWLLDGGWLHQAVIRYGIRRQLRDRINAIHTTSLEEAYQAKMQYVKALRTRPMAIETATANSQHYEVATGFLKTCLGPRMKYSCCLYPTGKETLGHAEVEMLDTYIEKAELVDGMRILDLGCENSYPRTCSNG